MENSNEQPEVITLNGTDFFESFCRSDAAIGKSNFAHFFEYDLGRDWELDYAEELRGLLARLATYALKSDIPLIKLEHYRTYFQAAGQRLDAAIKAAHLHRDVAIDTLRAVNSKQRLIRVETFID